MNKKQRTMFIPALTYAGIIFGVMVILNIVFDVTGLKLSRFDQISGNLIPAAGIFYAMYSYRKEYNQNIISFSRVFGFGVLVSLIMAFLLSSFSFIYTHYINPDLLEIAQQMAEDRMLEKGLDPDVIEKSNEITARYKTPFNMIFFGTLLLAILGTLFSIIAAAILKREPKNPFEGIE